MVDTNAPQVDRARDILALAPWDPDTTRARSGAWAGTKPKDLATDVAELQALVERMAAPETDLEGHAHPLFGPLSSAEWVRWGYLHMDHHLRQFGV